jgi:glucose/mannose-6-phosphate isomerase
MELTPQQIKKLDPADMYRRIYEFPEQLQEGYNLQIRGDLSTINTAEIKNIVIIGMGGSAIGGDILRSYLAEEVAIPILVSRNYSLPRFVNQHTLLIAASYSGNTEETLAAFEQGKQRGCQIIIATTGGKLGALAVENNYPHVILPAGLQPRAALGYSFGPLLQIMERLGYVSGQREIIEATCAYLSTSRKKLGMNVAENRNAARQLAKKLKDKIAVVYAGADYYDTVAIRFKGQICENAKSLAYANICPEFNHNELVGFDFPPKLVAKLVVIFLTGPADSQGVTKRFKIINKILTEKKITTVSLKAQGPNRLAEIFTLIQFGDLASYYLALINKTDPSPVHVINRLKTALEKMN